MITNNTFLGPIIICGVIGAMLILLSICMVIITIAEYRTNKYKDKLKNLYMYEYSCAYSKYINEFSVKERQNNPASFVLAKNRADDYMNLYFYNALWDTFSGRNTKKYLSYYLANKDIWTNEVLNNIQNEDNIKEYSEYKE